METAHFKVFVLVFWLASMTWLLMTKMLPLSLEPPQGDGQYFASPQVDSASGRWLISAQGDDVGWTEMRARRLDDGTIEVSSELQLEHLRLEDVAKEIFRGWSALLKYVQWPEARGEFSLQAATQILLATDGALQRWEMNVGLLDASDRIRIVGEREGDQMHVRICLVPPKSDHPTATPTSTEVLFHTRIDLPREALTVDSFAPQPRLCNLRVGDRWRFQSYQAFPPSSAPHIVEANVERTELLVWDSDIQSTFVVQFRDVSGNRPTVAEGAYSTLWVLSDGTVVKQLTRFATLELGFQRVPGPSFAAEPQ